MFLQTVSTLASLSGTSSSWGGASVSASAGRLLCCSRFSDTATAFDFSNSAAFLRAFLCLFSSFFSSDGARFSATDNNHTSTTRDPGSTWPAVVSVKQVHKASLVDISLTGDWRGWGWGGGVQWMNKIKERKLSFPQCEHTINRRYLNNDSYSAVRINL